MMDGDSLCAYVKANIDIKLAKTPINAEEHCIFKVHEQLLKVNKKAYKPVLLAIGPYNDHGQVAQGLMEEHKLRYLEQMLRRRSERSVEAYISALIQLEERTRNCYAERITLKEGKFVEMMLLDGCFIIELFRKCKGLSRWDQHDPILRLRWMLPEIARDLVLFENELPFFVLTTLFEMSEESQTLHPNRSEYEISHQLESSTSIDQSGPIRRFGDLALHFFHGLLPFEWNVNGSSSYSINDAKHLHKVLEDTTHLLSLPRKDITLRLAKMVHEHLKVGNKLQKADFRHLLDLIHTVIRLSVLDMELHRAIKCQEVGVKFKKGENSELYWNSIPYGRQLQEAAAKSEIEEKFKDKFRENSVWKSNTQVIPDAIAFQVAEIDFKKAKKFLSLVNRNRNEDEKKQLCLTTFKMVDKFMSLPFLNKIEYWNSIPNGRKLKEAEVEFKNAKKFRDAKAYMMKSITNATELKESGVKFKKAEQRTLFAIQFSNGVLEIPPLKVQDGTETYLRNLIAFEQYSPYKESNYVTDYICFMDDLIESPKDVELLRQKGIIDNWLGEDKVISPMFNKLGHHVTWSRSKCIYVKTSIHMNKHCAKRWNVWMAKLRHNYFSSPWALLSVLAAVILLGLAITQTVFSIIHD